MFFWKFSSCFFTIDNNRLFNTWKMFIFWSIFGFLRNLKSHVKSFLIGVWKIVFKTCFYYNGSKKSLSNSFQFNFPVQNIFLLISFCSMFVSKIQELSLCPIFFEKKDCLVFVNTVLIFYFTSKFRCVLYLRIK